MNAFGAPKPAKPGTKKKEDGVFDLEQQLILRLPPGPAVALRREVEQGSMNLKDKLFIEMQPDMRHCRVTFGGQIMSAKLMDLPAVVECLKTTDQKTFYKAADMAQMLVCSMEDEDSGEEGLSPSKRRGDKEKKYVFNHGLTPPLKNVSKRRFRKTLKKKYQEQPDIEKEVKRLLRADNEAIDVRWEVVVEEEQVAADSGENKQVLAQGQSHIMDEDSKPPTLSSTNLLEVAEHEIFGDLSSSDEDDDKDVNIVDSAGEDTNMSFPRVDTKDSLTSLDYPADLVSQDYAAGLDVDTGDLISKLEDLQQQLQVLRERRLTLQMDIDLTDELDAKDRMEQNLAVMVEEENEKQQEYEILASMINQD